jgi:hypothetical protein
MTEALAMVSHDPSTWSRRFSLAIRFVCEVPPAPDPQYQTYSTYWPQTFRAKHRSTIAVLFIRALVLRARLTEHLPFILHAHFRPANSDVPVTPSTVARRAIQDYRDVLNSSTRFPKAGECNIQVEELTDLCAAVWEAGGSKSSDAAWVMDVSVPQKDEGCWVTSK